jgi:DNA-binding PadR family transcriptional regulator
MEIAKSIMLEKINSLGCYVHSPCTSNKKLGYLLYSMSEEGLLNMEDVTTWKQNRRWIPKIKYTLTDKGRKRIEEENQYVDYSEYIKKSIINLEKSQIEFDKRIKLMQKRNRDFMNKINEQKKEEINNISTTYDVDIIYEYEQLKN